MQRFQAALKMAMTTKSSRLDLVAGQKFALETPNGRQEQDGNIDAALVGGLLQMLFNNKIPTTVEKSKLSIKGVGDFPVIAFPKDKKISIFFGPVGLQMFTKEWTDFQKANAAPAPAPAAAPKQAVAPAPEPQQAAPAPEPVIQVNETLEEQILAAPPAEESKIEVMPVPPLAELVPEPTQQAPIQVAPEPMAETATKAKAAPATDRIKSLDEAFDSGAFREEFFKEEDGASGGAPKTKTGLNPLPGGGGGEGITAQQIVVNLAEPEKKVEKIFWGANKPGSSMVSDGNNPIDALFKKMFENKASDLHLSMNNPVMMRIDGDIERLPDLGFVDEKRMQELLEPIMPPANYEQFVKENDTDFAYEIRGLSRFRCNVFRDHQGVGAVMRIIPQKILTTKDLNCPPVFEDFGRLTKGLVLVTGPTGSGKSTTLAAIVDWINKNRTDHIITVEDPVEFTHKQQNCLVNHREVGNHTGSFKRALKAALREDPDIVLVGELRDLETVAIAIETAETGHLVFGTLHTNTAISTVDRIIDQFPSEQQEQIRMMLSNSLKGVVAQILVKKVGGGRLAAHEILVVNDAVASLIREGKTHMISSIMQSQKSIGNILMDESLMKFLVNKQITPEEAYMKSIRKQEFKETLIAKGYNLDMSKVEDDGSGVQAPKPGEPGKSAQTNATKPGPAKEDTGKKRAAG